MFFCFLRLRCSRITVVLPCHASSILHSLQITHFLLLFKVKCSHAVEDFIFSHFHLMHVFFSIIATLNIIFCTDSLILQQTTLLSQREYIVCVSNIDIVLYWHIRTSQPSTAQIAMMQAFF